MTVDYLENRKAIGPFISLCKPAEHKLTTNESKKNSKYQIFMLMALQTKTELLIAETITYVH